MITRIKRLARKVLPQDLYQRAALYIDWGQKTWAEARAVRRKHGISLVKMLGEQAWLFARHGINPYAYYEYRLYEPRLTFEEKARYLSEGRRVNRRLWSVLAPARYRILYNNKLIFHHFFSAAGLPVATLYGVFDPVLGHTADGRPLRTAAQLQALLQEVGAAGFVFKPLHGIRGDRVRVFAGPALADPASPDAAAWLTLAGERYDAQRLVALTAEGTELTRRNPGVDPRTFLLEERLCPHPALAALLGPTLCTVRIQTIINRAGTPEIVAAVFKLQPGTAGVDHLLHGAVGCWVELATGRLGPGRSRQHHDDVTLIPGTERSFVGYPLPDWPAARAMALRAAAIFPWVRSIGWDIGLSERGPVVIEGNERWSPSLIQKPAPHGLLTGELKALCDELAGQRTTS